MTTSRNKLYMLLFTACIAGYIWLYYSMSNYFVTNKSFDGCIVKKVTNIPCPSCGSTRSILALTQGNFYEALATNPIGIIVAVIMVVIPMWIIIDLLARKKSLFDCYNSIETRLKTPHYAIPFILLVAINWIWNITKGL